MFTIDTNFSDLVAAAKEQGIKYVGMKKEALVATLNANLEVTEGEAPAAEQTPVERSKKWFEEEGFAFEQGQKVKVIAGPLEGRYAIIDKPSAKKNAVKAFLIKPNTVDTLQKTNITLDYDKIEVAVDAAVAEAV